MTSAEHDQHFAQHGVLSPAAQVTTTERVGLAMLAVANRQLRGMIAS